MIVCSKLVIKSQKAAPIDVEKLAYARLFFFDKNPHARKALSELSFTSLNRILPASAGFLTNPVRNFLNESKCPQKNRPFEDVIFFFVRLARHKAHKYYNL